MTLFLQSLPAESEFQIVSFGSHYTYLFGQAKMVPLTKENLQKANEAVNSFEADMGGTQILPALKTCFEDLLDKELGTAG